MTAEHTFSVQLSNSNRSVANLEEIVRSVEQDKHQLLLDLSAARDLCSRLELAKDGLQRQVVSKALDQEKVAMPHFTQHFIEVIDGLVFEYWRFDDL